MKIRISLFFWILFFCVYCLASPANAEYREVRTSQGRVIIGLDKEKTLEKFGLPTSASKDLWCYTTPKKFFVYFSPDSLMDIYLYPEFCEASTGMPIELKAFGYFSDLTIKDISSKVQFLIKETEDFVFDKPGVIIPKKTGEYRIFAQYQDILSKPSHLTIKKSEGQQKIEEEKCLNISVLPYKPVVAPESIMEVIAMGTFIDNQGKYSVRNISKEVDWFIKKDTEIISARNNRIQFPLSPGKLIVFCKYKELESFPEEVEVNNNYTQFEAGLKHITLLPEFIFTSLGNETAMRAFGSYHNNRVEEITSRVRWTISDKETIKLSGNNNFFALAKGVSDIIAGLDYLKSLPTKIVVVGEEELSPATHMAPAAPKVPVAPMVYAKAEIKKVYAKDPQNLVREIKENTEKVSKKVLEEGKKLETIKIVPDDVRVPLGVERQLTALGVYNDDSQEDLTLLGEWLTSDYKVFIVSKGKIYTRMFGQAHVSVKYKDIISLPVKVIVEKPSLISIVISPTDSKISMRDKLNFKAEGIFSDSSRSDITSFVSWEVSNPKVLKIEQIKAVAHPLAIGESEVYAKFLEIKSLSAYVKVMVTVNWLIYTILKTILFFFLCIIILFAVLYFITENKKNTFKASLEKNPKEFIIKLYNNARGVLSIFGFKHKGFLPPLSYAQLADANYSVKRDYYEALGIKNNATVEEIKNAYHKLALQYHPDRVSAQEKMKAAERFKKISEAYSALSDVGARNVFFRFTTKFEEAAYSQHILKPQDALSTLGDYNIFLKMLLSYHSKFNLFFKYCLTLLQRSPFFYI